MTRKPAIISSLVSVVLVAAVTLSSVHASHVVGLASSPIDAKKSLHDDSMVKDSKVTPDLHHHTDKQSVNSILKVVNDHPSYADARVLHPTRDGKHRLGLMGKFRNWWQLHTLHLS